MTSHPPNTRLNPLLPALMFAAVLVFAWWAYGLGTTGGWHFDDRANLSGLEQIEDLTSGLIFSTSGIAGPLKRPVALASFALQAQSWPDHPENFLRVNVYIHLFNGVLVFWLAGLLASFVADEAEQGRRWGFALAVAAAWVLSPFLASASLMAVQRMTTLTAGFMFLGLIGYLLGRQRMAASPRSGLLLALFSMGAATLLAAFTKENGLLLPVLALLCEIMIIRRAQTALPRLPRAWFYLALALPTALIIGYLTWRGISGHGYGSRGFDVGQRLLTQARIVWDYIFALLAPRAGTITPYSDGWQASKSLLEPITTLFAVLGLGALLAGMMIFARRWPRVVFGLAWCFAAQLIESTTVALELYFAHRVYVPAFGLFFALAWPLFFSARLKNLTWLAPLISSLFAAASALVLAYTAWLWGQPDRAAVYWYKHSPVSIRAGQKLASTYSQKNSPALADRILAQSLAYHPDNIGLVLQRLNFCPQGRPDAQARLNEARKALEPPNRLDWPAAFQLHNLSLKGFNHCALYTPGSIDQLAQVALQKPQRHRSSRTTVYLHYTLAQLAEKDRRTNDMRQHLKQALKLEADPQTAVLIAYSYVLDHDLPAARNWLQQQLDHPPPINQLQQARWNRQIGQYLHDLSN